LILYKLLNNLFLASTCDNHGPNDIYATTSNVYDHTPLWNLPNCDIEYLDEYLRFVQLIKDMIDVMSNNSLSTSLSNILRNDITPLTFHNSNIYNKTIQNINNKYHVNFILYNILTLIDMSYGQENEWIERFKKGIDKQYNSGIKSNVFGIVPTIDMILNTSNNTVDDFTDHDNDDDVTDSISLWEIRNEGISLWLHNICTDLKNDLLEDVNYCNILDIDNGTSTYIPT
jgi:hypothetical protein